jgi:hypothetical protein
VEDSKLLAFVWPFLIANSKILLTLCYILGYIISTDFCDSYLFALFANLIVQSKSLMNSLVVPTQLNSRYDYQRIQHKLDHGRI